LELASTDSETRDRVKNKMGGSGERKELAHIQRGQGNEKGTWIQKK